MARKTRSDSTVGSFEKSCGLLPSTVRNLDGRGTRSEKKIGTIRNRITCSLSGAVLASSCS